MPAVKRTKSILPLAEEATMLSPAVEEVPLREVPTYDARVFDRFVKAVRELESAMNSLADASFTPAVSTVATPLYSEQNRKHIHTRYSLNYQLYKEHPPLRQD